MKKRERGRPKLYGSGASDEQVRRAFTDGPVTVAVYGLGKMGLPLATVYASVNGRVIGVDADQAVVSALTRGECTVDGEPGLPSSVRRAVETQSLVPTTDGKGAAGEADVHVIIVPVTLQDDHTPDLSTLVAVVDDVAAGLEAGDLVVLESTVPPGATDEIAGMLADAADLDRGEFGVAFCPERTMSGSALEDIMHAHPRVVGGVDAESTRIARLLYDEITSNDVLPVSDAKTAECVKLFEGVYRDVNIALANELATLVDELGVDAMEAIHRANTQPYCDILDPGAGVGGHCIPFYPHFLMNAVDSLTPLMSTARETNESMPLFVVSQLLREFGGRDMDLAEAKVAVLGVTYRPGVNEVRKSPAYPITDRLSDLGATVYAIDPVRTDMSDFSAIQASMEDLYGLDLDAAVLLTAHEEFAAIEWDRLDPLFVVDGRQALDLRDTNHRVYTIGSGFVGNEGA